MIDVVSECIDLLRSGLDESNWEYVKEALIKLEEYEELQSFMENDDEFDD